MFILEYIWLDAKNKFRSKIKVVLPKDIPALTHSPSIENFPNWNFDGSSTGQAKGNDTEVILKPVYMCPNPFLGYKRRGFLVLCETYDTDGKALPNNHREKAKMIFEEKNNLKPWYGFEQEYFILNPDTRKPLGFKRGNLEAQGKYYCGVGYDMSFGREIMLKHLDKCLEAQLTISGTNAEVAPGQWEYQVGPVEGVEASDQLMISRYILERIAEEEKVLIELHPKPLGEKWNGSGCHTNFSTKEMREDNGLKKIMECINNLEKKSLETINIYGEENDKRLTGLHETSSQTDFSWGIGTRNTSIRIGNETFLNKKGYMEDRRPASNMNPYLVSSYLVDNC